MDCEALAVPERWGPSELIEVLGSPTKLETLALQLEKLLLLLMMTLELLQYP